MKYKVGDKVKVRKWEDMKKEFTLDSDGDIKLGCYIYFVKSMKKYCGKSVTIKETSIDDKYEIYKIEEDAHWNWSDDMFEDICDSKKPTNKFFFKGDKTIYYDKDGKRYVVKCCEDDVYDKKVGMLYVLAKAQGIDLREIDKLIEEPKKEQKKDRKTKWKVGDKFVIIDDWVFASGIHKGDKGKIIEDEGSYFLLNIKNFEQLVRKEEINKYLRRI